jgi:hypothetical protein
MRGLDPRIHHSGKRNGTAHNPALLSCCKGRIRVTFRVKRIKEIYMLGRIVAATLAFGGLMTSNIAHAEDPVAGVVAGAIVGAAIASGAVVPYEHREPLREYVVRENRPSYRYEGDVVVGRELPRGEYESYPVPERYGVREHHYAIVNDRVVVFHPETRRIIHVYE